MSGGHFDYSQYKISQIAEEIRHLIVCCEEKRVNEWGDSVYEFSEETVNEFRKSLEYLDKAFIYAQRIDWLVSGDDGEDSFHKRLKHDLEKLEKSNE